MSAQDSKNWLGRVLSSRLPAPAAKWLEAARGEITSGVDPARFAVLLSLCSRHAPRTPLAPTSTELAEAALGLPGWNPERWTSLEAMRVSLVLERPDLDAQAGVDAVEEAFRFADEGELCALYKCLALLPDPKRFLWRAAEGCRTNIVPVFESVACDTPYPASYFDDVAFRQLAIKAVFIGAPLWRVSDLDRRIDAELARMALDLAEERRSAGRDVQPELWLCLGTFADERGLDSLNHELESGSPEGRRAALFALARAGRTGQVQEHLEGELAETARFVLEHRNASDFSSLELLAT